MNQELMKEFKADLKEFREMTEKFYAKEVSVKDYKGFSGGFGSYAQKGGEASMLRLRMPGGRVTKEKLKFLVDSIERYDVKRAGERRRAGRRKDQHGKRRDIRKSTGWRRKAYADYDSIRKRSDWYFEGDLVSYAISA